MAKRLLIGLIKGLVIGGAIGAGIQYGLHWPIASGGVLGYLLAMGASGTTGVFAGKPPWLEGAWIEASLKGMVGVGIGALVYWLGSRYGALAIPFPGVEGSTPWTAIPVVFLPAMTAIYGALVELDNTGDDASGGTKKKSGGPKARVAVDAEDEMALDETVHADRTKAARRKS